jgi:hypothetical protein
MAESNELATLDQNVQPLRYSTAPVCKDQQGCLLRIAVGGLTRISLVHPRL